MPGLEQVAWWLMILGAVNWGLVGLLNLNVVELVLGTLPVLVQVVYVLVGLAGAYYLLNLGGKKR